MKNMLFSFIAVLVLALVAIPITVAAQTSNPPVFRPDAGTMHSGSRSTATGLVESTTAVQIPNTATMPSNPDEGVALITLSDVFDVHVEISLTPDQPADDAGTYNPKTGDACVGCASNTLTNFTVLCYLQHPVTKKWGHHPDLDFAVKGGDPVVVKAGLKKPTNLGRIAFVVPSGLPHPTNVRLVSVLTNLKK